MGNTVPFADLFRVLSDAHLFAGGDATLPMLQCVRLEASETQLVAVATDRFLVGVARTDNYEGAAFTANVPLSFVKQVLKAWRPLKRMMWRADVEVTETEVVFTLPDGQSMSHRLSDFEFVKWRALFQGVEGSSDSPAVLGLNPAYFAKFAKVESARHVVWRTSAARPNLVTIGSNFQGLLMPVRLEEAQKEDVLTDWMSELVTSG
ncbi:hypothetical protein [Nocardia sp. NPDC050435]|uniref:hypothetical protein n=1 Tax=Nocardia sp. NPDC050435 TaxID=3155040 RepID=UPI0033E7533D